jgi:hypothetical protein
MTAGEVRADISSHIRGTPKGEELLRRRGPEPGRYGKDAKPHRTARDATSINADARDPIDPKMPFLPPA